jgi:hypothetical protein
MFVQKTVERAGSDRYASGKPTEKGKPGASQGRKARGLDGRDSSAASAGAVGLGVAFCAALAAPAALAVTSTVSSCSVLSVSQPFSAYGDLDHYGLVPGQATGGFTGASWSLSGNAHLVSAASAGGSSVEALDLPAGASATSPCFYVQTVVPLVRVFTRMVGASASYLQLQVHYPGVSVSPTLVSAPTSWTLSPQIRAWSYAALAPVSYTLTSRSKSGDLQLYDLYVDPRYGGAL